MLTTSIIITIFCVATFILWTWYKITQRATFIDNYRFPKRINQQLAKTYPHLNTDQINSIIIALRSYFHLCNQARSRQMVSMPSQAVDVAWHEFILFTRAYDSFCKQALGRFLHHTPAEAMSSPMIAQRGIKTAWRLACRREKINPKNPTHLPDLFAIDALCAIPDGFSYRLNCQTDLATANHGGQVFCASHIGCSGCGGGSSSGDDFDNDSDCCGGGCGGCGGD